MKDFTSIFNSEKTKNNPIVHDIKEVIDNYNAYIPSLDDPYRWKNYNLHCVNIGSRVSIDGIPPGIAKILPESFRMKKFDLMNRIFTCLYPDEWCKQIHRTIPMPYIRYRCGCTLHVMVLSKQRTSFSARARISTSNFYVVSNNKLLERT